jgi:hypothetical protein
MKRTLQLILITFLFLFSKNVNSQNVSINVVTQSAGIVKKDELIFFEVVINNTSSTKIVSSYKLRPQISFPNEFVTVQETGHVLPKGWIVVSNKKGVVILSNGTDNIGQNDSRSILLSFKGKELGGPFTIMGNLLFSNGIAPGSAIGVSTVGDILADNISTSTVMVVK